MNHPYKIFLPQLGNQNPIPKKIGIDCIMPTSIQAKKIYDLGARYCTIGNLQWSKIESEKNHYDQNWINYYRNILDNVIKSGLIVLPTVHSTPKWALLNNSVGATNNYRDFAKLMEMLTSTFNAVKHWQIFNEVDSAESSFPESYGGWGDSYLLNYVKVLENIQHLRNNNVNFSTSLMLPKNSDWYIQFSKLDAEKLIDHLNFHFYWPWWKGFDIADINYALTILENKIKELQQLFSIPLWLTETNLLYDGTSNSEYEEMKARWIEKVIPFALTNGVECVIIYSYHSGWRNANIKNLPAEKSFSDICKNL